MILLLLLFFFLAYMVLSQFTHLKWEASWSGHYVIAIHHFLSSLWICHLWHIPIMRSACFFFFFFFFSPFNFRNILILFMSQKLYKYSKFDMRKILNLFFGKIWGQSVRLKCWKTISKSNLKVGLEV